jgi:hypothetical protein
MPRKISPSTSPDTLRKQARRWLKALRSGDADARARFEHAYPAAAREPVLRDVQHALAREYGHESWKALQEAVAAISDRAEPPEDRPLLSAGGYETLAQDHVLAFNSRDEAALDRLNRYYQRSFTFDDLWAETWRRIYSFRQRAFRSPQQHLELEEARSVLAQDAGFNSWAALLDATETGAPAVPAFAIDAHENRLSPQRQLSDREWDRLIAVMKERRVTALDAGGQMTDAVLARIAQVEHITSLSLGGSRQLTDDGLLHMARMPQLEQLNLSEYPGGRLTDRGLQVLRQLPNLRRFEMTWQSGVSDEGVANLRFCERLEQVDLMGSPTGDGAIRALAGKPNLRRFSTGRLVTDAGLPVLHEFPRLKTWHGPSPTASGPSNADEVGHLLIDGPFTDRGFAGLAGLEGVADLDLFWHVSGLTSQGFAALRGLPNLLSFAADGRLSDDDAMRHIAAIPRLRQLRAQESVATDEGFEALSRSATLEGFWGRVCPNFGNRAFRAFSKMPALQRMGVGCANVDDDVLAAFPDFPALRELTPIGVRDTGFKHIGRCDRLERLTCMYCRETTDEATAHIASLKIRYYYAGLTLITDRSLEILGRMPTLEQIEFYECNAVTDAGLPFLAALPHLREVALEGLPGVTLAGTKVFGPGVRVRYST